MGAGTWGARRDSTGRGLYNTLCIVEYCISVEYCMITIRAYKYCRARRSIVECVYVLYSVVSLNDGLDFFCN